MKRQILAILAAVLVAGNVLAGQLTGRVLDTANRPVSGAVVSLMLGDRTLRAVAGRDGHFVLELPEEAHPPLELAVTAPGYQEGRLQVDRSSAPVEVVLVPSRTFSDTVEVTANRAVAGQTPVTLSNVTREQIDRSYWGQDVPVFLSQVPGFYAYNDNGNGIGYSYFTLRGFDMRRTAVSLNGVPLNDAESHGVFFIDLADFLSTTEDIQVQRGVGTSAYGGSAIGGSVDLATRHPLTEPRLRATFLGGSWDTYRYNLEYDTGLSSNGWAATFRLSKIDTQGYRDQSWVNMWNVYANVEHYGERSSLRLTLFGGPEETHLAYYGISKDYLDGKITGDRRRDRRYNPLTWPGEIDHFLQPHFQLQHIFQVNPDLTLENTLFLFTGNGYFKQYKTDRWMPEYGLPPFESPDGGLIEYTDLIRKREIDEWDTGWIGQALWHHLGGRGTLRGGVALRLHNGHHWGTVEWAEHYPPDLPPGHRYYDYQVDKRTMQPFVEESLTLGRAWTLMGGLTWTSHRYEMDKDRVKGVSFSETYQYLLPRLGLTWRPAKGWSVFANVSRGAREPAFRDIYDPQDYWSERVHLHKEELTDYELGGERRWKTGYARLNLYWLHFSNEIVWAGGLDDSGVPITANGAVSNHRGIELETGWTPRPRFGAHLALSYSLNTFSKFLEFDWDGNPVDHSGNRIAGIPDWLANLQLTGGWGPMDA
ncbi:MAG TPA: TonB-dependent receptor, partial [Acidobacteria bacterium]|nr:TonB-dependent receptor [Acidobacteriota bacterium]